MKPGEGVYAIDFEAIDDKWFKRPVRKRERGGGGGGGGGGGVTDTGKSQTRSEVANVALARGCAPRTPAGWRATRAPRRASADAPPALERASCRSSSYTFARAHTPGQQHSGLVPIVYTVQHLQKRLLDEAQRPVFARAWNFVDAYLRCVHGEDSPHYRMLRQAMMCRRALLLLDGIDEGGKARAEIEKHVTEVLAPLRTSCSSRRGRQAQRPSRLASIDCSRPLADAAARSSSSAARGRKRTRSVSTCVRRFRSTPKRACVSRATR